MKVINVVGARPNFIKIAPIIEAMNECPGDFDQRLVHTGQHYDDRMSERFFGDLGVPEPDIHLGIGSDTHARQTARIMSAFEDVCRAQDPDLVLVVGDVNSTLAAALTAKKLDISVAHVEAGLRSGDMSMPEEINRLCTDAISDFLFTTDKYANENLKKEGIGDDRIHFVGNVMIDSLERHRTAAEQSRVMTALGIKSRAFGTLTLHRPSNVDDGSVLKRILQALAEIATDIPVIFPVHPRTKRRIEEFGLSDYWGHAVEDGRGLVAIEPLGYLDFLHLNMHARFVLTDSGGLQEESTVLGVPCVTLRENTERPITCIEGTNRLVGTMPESIIEAVAAIRQTDMPTIRIPEKWDGQAAKRIAQVLRSMV